MQHRRNNDSNKEISKTDLYESVKTLVEANESGDNYLHLNQAKLYTLFSISFQYLMYLSTKSPGAYIIRVENGSLAHKLVKKSKDQVTRRFMGDLLMPRKLKYQNSMFYLDFFTPASWSLTRDIPAEKIKGVLVVRDAHEAGMLTDMVLETPEDVELYEAQIKGLPEDFYVTGFINVAPKIVAIAYGKEFEKHGLKVVRFPFITEEKRTLSGVTLSKDLDWDNLD